MFEIGAEKLQRGIFCVNIEEAQSETLRIPNHCCGNQLRAYDTVYLEGSCGCRWAVQIGSGVFSKGWKFFARHIGVSLGDRLVFEELKEEDVVFKVSRFTTDGPLVIFSHPVGRRSVEGNITGGANKVEERGFAPSHTEADLSYPDQKHTPSILPQSKIPARSLTLQNLKTYNPTAGSSLPRSWRRSFKSKANSKQEA